MTNRELDAALAEKLFGWGEWSALGDQAKWSSTGDGMLQVLDALKARGLTTSIEQDGGGWWVAIGPAEVVAEAVNDALPRAVAEAALAALA